LKIDSESIFSEYSNIISIDVDRECTNDIFIYPNPVKDILSVILPKDMGESADFYIYNAFGKFIQHGIIFNDNSNKINLSNIPNGIYYLVVYTKNKKYLERIVK